VALYAKHGYSVFDSFPLNIALIVTEMIFMNFIVALKLVLILSSWAFELLCFACLENKMRDSIMSWGTLA
jgi:hypothetical protein